MATSPPGPSPDPLSPASAPAPAPSGRRAGPIARARARVHALLASHLGSRELFVALFVGAMVGATPFYGLHLALCVALSWLLRLNTAAMYASANISIPPLIPFLGFACVQVGERLLHGGWLPLRVDDFKAMAAGPGGVQALMTRFFVDWMAGGLLVGAGVGVVIGGVVFLMARARDARRGLAPRAPAGAASDEAIDVAIAEASRRYRAAPRNLRYYAVFKYRLDPCYRRIAQLVPPGTLTVDLGTGLGMLPLVLALLPGEREALGVEWDAAKLVAGRAAANGLPRVRLVEGDVREADLPPCDVVTLVDVLHYHPTATQQAILARAAAALRPGGVLLVREGDADRRGGAAWTRWLEAVAVGIGWNRGDGATRFRSGGELARALAALGLTVTVEPLAGRLHPGNVLVSAQKPGGETFAMGPAS